MPIFGTNTADSRLAQALSTSTCPMLCGYIESGRSTRSMYTAGSSGHTELLLLLVSHVFDRTTPVLPQPLLE